MWGSRYPILEFSDPPYISRKVEARNFKFSIETDGGELLRNKFKIGSKGVMWGSRDPIVEFWVPLLPGEWLKLNFKFGIENDDNIY